MTTVIVVTVVVLLLVVAAVTFGIRAVLRKRNKFLQAMRQGYQEGSAAPGAAEMPCGAGGYTAAQTTAMAERMLGAMGGKPKASFLTPDVTLPPKED